MPKIASPPAQKSHLYSHTHEHMHTPYAVRQVIHSVGARARAHTHTHMLTFMQQSTKVPPGRRHEQSSPFAPPSLDAHLPTYSCIRTCIDAWIDEYAQRATSPPARETQHVLYCRERKTARARESRGGWKGTRERPVCRHGTRDSTPQ